MSVFRVEKNRNYTVMSNHHLQDDTLSLKAKGLLSLMLSLPESWDYTMSGLARICRDGVSSIQAAIGELEESGYLRRSRIRNANGQLGDTEYVILEKPDKAVTAEISPICENPILDNPTLEKPILENRTQLNTKVSSKEISSMDLSIHPSISAEQLSMDELDRMCGKVRQQVDFEGLCHYHAPERVKQIVRFITETLCYRGDTLSINGQTLPVSLVKSRLRELEFQHIEYVFECMDKTTTEIRNIRSYLLTSLYNAPVTIDQYYLAAVRHDENARRGGGAL